MRDGSVVRGQIIRQDSSLITVRVRGGDFSYVEADQVARISAVHPDESAIKTLTDSPATSTVFVLKDGTQLPGTFVRQNNIMITVRKRNGQLTYFEPELLLRVDTVRSDMHANGIVTSGKPLYVNQFSAFLPFNPTAFNPEKGRFYYRNTLLILNELYYGVTSNWSVGVNVNPFFGSFEKTNSARETVLGATYRFFSRLTFPIGDQFRFGVNAMYQPRQKGYFYAMEQQIVLQGLLSFGNTQRNVTMGYGMRILPDYDFDLYSKTPFISAGLMHKLSGSLTILSDNTFYLNPYLSNGSANLSLAFRLDRQRHAFDLGAVAVVQPRFTYYSGTTYPGGYYSSMPSTYSYFYPYIAYNLLIGRK
ncbi:hypothetical protein GCM10028805_46260 [Spirosoma harenae]